MQEREFNNADSFAMAFDETWDKIDCSEKDQKIKKVIEHLSEHPFVLNNYDNALAVAKFRLNSLGKFK